MRVRIPGKGDTAAVIGEVEPNLARAAPDLVRFVARFFRVRRKRAAEIDEVVLAIVPVVEKSEVGDDVVKSGHGGFGSRGA